MTRILRSFIRFRAPLAGALLAAALAAGCSTPRGNPEPAGASPARIEAVRQNTLGVAYMTRQSTEQALGLFQAAYEADPTFRTARLNQAIALFHLQRLEEASEILSELTAAWPDYTRAWYNLGLTYRNLGRPVDAAGAFQRAVDLDPGDADSHYMLGLMQFQAGNYTESLDAFDRAMAIRPNHASAAYGTARAHRMAGNIEQAISETTRYQEIVAQQLDAPLGSSYGDQGPYALAEDAAGRVARPDTAIDVRFEPANAGFDAAHRPSGDGSSGLLEGGACVLDFDADGAADIFLPGADNSGRLYRNDGAGLFRGTDVTVSATACAAGDFDNDESVDLAVSGPDGVTLLRNAGGGAFEDVSEAAGVTAAPSPGEFAMGLGFVDYDHDGDLDLYVVRAAASEDAPPGADAGNTLWRNNGDGTFTDVTAETALGLGADSNAAAVVTDIDNDRAIDFVATGPTGPVIRLNARIGEFDTLEWTEPFPGAAAGVAVLDFDKDSWMDLAFTHGDAPGLTLWRNVDGTAFERVALPETGWSRGWGLTGMDYDNDGWVDLAAVGDGPDGGEVRVFRNRGVDGFEDTSGAVGLSEVPVTRPRALVTADFDSDGDRDLLVALNGGSPLVLRNDGGNANASLEIRLVGLADNTSGIGTKVEVFAGVLRQKVEVHGATGYMGQNAPTAHFGLGNNAEADAVRMLWPTGVPQDEVELAARQTHVIGESDRRGSSCPVLFCWNGETYGFVTDAIGAGILGHWVAPGQRNVSDPTEYVRVPGAMVAPRDGMLSFRLAEPMEEIVYLDQVRLLAVDHPASVEVYPHEYFAVAPPFPEFGVIAARDARPPRGAWDEQGRDVLDRLTAIDRRYVDGFEEAPFRGFADMHSLELDLGDIDTGGPVRLLMHGFIDYFTATSAFAAHQAGLVPVPPYIEALNDAGEWVRVIEDVGFPAGLTRTLARDITGRLPEGTRRIRMTTNLQIYWDRILIDATPEPQPFEIQEVPLASATLEWLGFPRMVTGDIPADVRYVYDEISRTGPYVRHAGAYTRFGDVLELSLESDNRMVIFGAGEQVALEFDPSGLEALPDDWVRDYFFYADGFAKDMDFYAAHATTVEPLPHHGDEPYPYPSGRTFPVSGDGLEYLLEMNTRHESGSGASSFRYEYD